MKVYIASPYSIGDTHENVKRQIEAAHQLMDAGFIPFAPLLSHYLHLYRSRHYEEWMQYDFDWIESCDAVLRLPGESKGADRECAFAKTIGIPVVYNIQELQSILT